VSAIASRKHKGPAEIALCAVTAEPVNLPRRPDCDAFGRLSCDMALPHKELKTPLWLYAVGIAVGFALGAGLALLFIR
jgi:hypothetical protein